jgi:hypothetical protein
MRIGRRVMGHRVTQITEKNLGNIFGTGMNTDKSHR